MNDLDNVHGTPFPPSRMTCYDDVRFYYSFCCTAPEDTLSSVIDVARPSVVLMGSGDARSIFYTLYRNFDPEFRGRFDGANFIVNENWSILQARDILMLYLCLQLPHRSESQEAKEMYAAIWAIWFCHTLYPPHIEILKNALEVLTKFSTNPEAWVSPENPLGRVVKFATAASFRDITKHWEQWNAEQPKNIPSVEEMVENRRKFLTCLHKMPMLNIVSKYPELCLVHLLGLSGEIISESRQQSMEADLASFLKMGTVFVEDYLNLSEEEDWKTTPNITFFDGTCNAMENNPFYGLVPFLGFFHTFVFSPKDCRSANIARSLADKLPVKDDKFEEHPLVANSIQQLALWISASSRVLRKLTSQTKPDITFTFECTDAISMCLRMLRDPDSYASQSGLQPSFDVIHTFQLIDCMSPPDLVLHATTLLKPNAFLLATTVRYRYVSYTLDRFMGTIFGVHPQIFAVMYGLRCMGVEATFSDCTLPRHSPWSHNQKYESGDIKTLVFKRHLFSPFKMSSLSDASFAPTALRSCTYATTHGFPTNSYSNQMCTETVISTILTFVAQMDTDTPVEKYTFWEPYVKLIQEQPNFGAYRQHLQVTAMLHNVHFHIVVNERDCPICRGRPLSSYVAQYSVEVSNPNLSPHSTLAVYVSRGHVEIENFLENVKDTHCIHSVTLRRDEEERTFVEFFFPKSFSEGDYRLTVMKFAPTDAGAGNLLHVPTMLYDGVLGIHVTKGSRYYFRPLPHRQTSLNTSFGHMKSNVAGCEKIRTVIAVTPDLVYKVDWKSLPVSSDQVTQQHLRLKCVHHQYDVYFPYPVLFPEMRIEFHCKLKTATITAPRDQHTFYEESPMFVVTPTNRLFMPAFPVNSSTPRDYLELQLNSLEEETLKRMPSVWIPPVIKLKHTLRDMFQLAPQCRFMHIQATSKKSQVPLLQGLVVIHDEVVDLDTRSPAIDISYCFLKESGDQEFLTAAWDKIISEQPVRTLTVDSDLLFFVKKMFGYFAARTRTVYSDNNRTSLCRIKLLRKLQINGYFTRAVIFPMYGCPDHQFEDRTVVREPEKTGSRFIAGVFAPSGTQMTGELKKVIETLSPQFFAAKAREQREHSRLSDAASVSVTGTSANSDGTDTLIKLIQESTIRFGGSGLFTFEQPSVFQRVIEGNKRTPAPRTRERGKKRKSSAAKAREKAKADAKVAVSVAKQKEESTTVETEEEKSAPEKREASVTLDEEGEEKDKPAPTITKVKNKAESEASSDAVAEKKNLAVKEKEPVPDQKPEAKITDNGAVQSDGSVDGIQDDGLEEERANNKGPSSKDTTTSGRPTHSSSSKGKCTNCGQPSEHMKKCAGCSKTRYCSRECQKQHWKQHKPHCTAASSEDGSKTLNGVKESSKVKKNRGSAEGRSATRTKSTPVVQLRAAAAAVTKCQTCGKAADNLKRCKCYAVSYCNVSCQRRDWSNHKKTCSAAPKAA